MMNPPLTFTKGKTVWHVFYTFPRAEKKVHQRLVDKSIETYLPLLRKEKLEVKGKEPIQIPLFRSYVFARCDTHTITRVLCTPGVVDVVRMGAIPAVIRDNTMQQIRLIEENQDEIEAYSGIIEPGIPVSIIRGCFKGFKGQVVQHQGKRWVMVVFEPLQYPVLIRENHLVIA
jgi:transcriptional antiterminator RfaH